MYNYMPQGEINLVCNHSKFIDCPECSKTFLCTNPGSWAFKRTDGKRGYIFCSWTCMRKYDKRKEDDAEKRKEQARLKRAEARAVMSNGK